MKIDQTLQLDDTRLQGFFIF